MKSAESGFSGRVKPTGSFLEGKVIIFKSVLSYFRNFTVLFEKLLKRHEGSHIWGEQKEKHSNSHRGVFISSGSSCEGYGQKFSLPCAARTEMLDIPAVLGLLPSASGCLYLYRNEAARLATQHSVLNTLPQSCSDSQFYSLWLHSSRFLIIKIANKLISFNIFVYQMAAITVNNRNHALTSVM